MASLEELTAEQVFGLAQLAKTLADSPQTREEFLKLTKKANPGLVIPEIDAKDAVLKEVQQEREARLALEKKLQERDIKENIERKKVDVKSKFNFSDSDMDEVEKIMLDEQIPSYETAAKYLSASRRVADSSFSQRSAVSRQMTMPDKEIWSKGLGNSAELRNIAFNEASKALDELKGFR
jgi:hypothetical protein